MVYCADGAPDIRYCQCNPRSVDLRPGAGVQPGEWKLRMVENSDVGDSCWVGLDGLERNPGRAESAHRAPSAPPLRRAGHRPGRLCPGRAGAPGCGAYGGQRNLAGGTHPQPRARHGALSLVLPHVVAGTGPAAKATDGQSLRDLVVRQQPLRSKTVCPVGAKLNQIARLIEASENAYAATLKAARIGRAAIRDSIIGEVQSDPLDLYT